MGTSAKRPRIGAHALAALAAVTALVGSSLLPSTTPQATAAVAAPGGPDGLTPETAAASCWEIKQNDRDSEDGVYWLITPTLVAPQQFYCDQEGYGGGWVLIGRGREGWSEDYDGTGTAKKVAATPDGPGAFTPAQLPARTVDGLLDGGRVDRLADGVRVRRASSIDGAYRQEVRFRFQQRDRWTWALGGPNPLRSWVFDGTSGTGGSTASFGSGDGWHSSSFVHRSSHKKKAGWAYGRTVSGTADSSSFLWAPAGQGSAIPFAQVFVRPKLKLADLAFAPTPSSGTPASAVRALPRSAALKTEWGVAQAASDDHADAQISAFGQVGTTVYAGGDFRHLQHTAKGIGRVEQPYLAAFDVTTGSWLPGFRPRLDGPVSTVAALPDGRVAIGGRFTTVDGAPQAALAFLDPATGALTGPQVRVLQREAGRLPAVTDLDVQGTSLYVAGSFTHLAAPDAAAAVARNGGRIDLATGLPDQDWNADLNGTALAVDASELGDLTYFSGYFTRTHDTTARSAAALRTQAAAPAADPRWAPAFSSAGVGAHSVVEAGGRVYLGATRRALAAYDRSSLRVLTGSLAAAGSDFQSIVAGGSLVVGGCACGRYTSQFQGEMLKRKTRKMRARALQVDRIDALGAWDAATGVYLPDWAPRLHSAGGLGVRASFFDSTGVLWTGGDLDASLTAGGRTQWSGGFARFAPGDATPPSTPGPLTSTPVAGGEEVVLTWGPSIDESDVVYEVLRGDRVIATTSSSTTTVPVTPTPESYVVRARDTAGNRSASTLPFVVQPPGPSALTFIGNRDSWAWRYSTTPLPADWAAPGFDDASWPVGRALFGAGVSGAETDIGRGRGAKPMSAQFRRHFDVSKPAGLVDGLVSIVADDGAVVYLNGTELGRVRMPATPVTGDTLATELVSASTAAGSRAVFAVPPGLLVEGDNVLAVSVHTAQPGSPDLSFDLAFTAARAPAPLPVTGLAARATADSVTLTWSRPSTGTAPASYAITRDGKRVGTVTAPTATFTDQALGALSTHRYTVVAVSADGQQSPPTALQASTLADTPVEVPQGSSWSWRYSDAPLPGGWNALGFDDLSWNTGAAPLGRGEARLSTDIDRARLRVKPLSAQFRHAFSVTHPESLRDGTLSVLVDDGVVVYLNGVELGRSNLPGGTITQNSIATGAPGYRTASARLVTFRVPASLLVSGTNVLAASVHANYRDTPDLAFDLSLSLPRR